MARGHDSPEPSDDQRYQIGREIVKKCKGHPLNISLMGSMLYFEKSEAEWKVVLDELFRSEPYEALIPKLMKLSYDHLPSPLKHCFAYCSLFQEDQEINVRTLIKLWMAQGFIHPPTSDQSPEDVGYEYFLNLLRRHFFPEPKIDLKGRVTKCKMYSLMHDVGVSAGGHCARLPSNLNINLYTNLCRIYHVSLDSCSLTAEWVILSLIREETMRSILFQSEFGRQHRDRPNDTFYDTMISRFRQLRVLDMHALGIKLVPRSIGKLKHLKYLDLSENEDITQLPNSIPKLLNLQTLRLSSCFRLKKLPKDIGNLVNLRHLENDGCYSLTSLPRGFDRLTNLQTLSQIILGEDASMRNDELEELKGLINLREEIQIKNLGHGMDNHIATCLEAIQKVRSLSLEWDSRTPVSNDKGKLEDKDTSNLFSGLEELALNGFGGETLFFNFSSKLVKLSLRRFAKCKSLRRISECKSLKVFVLDEMIDLEYVEDESISSSQTFFPALHELWLTELPKLQGWCNNSKNLPSFPCLSKLVIEDCPKLGSMPLFPTLEEGLVLDSTSWKPFEDTMKHRAKPAMDEASSSTSPSSPLSKLKNLCIVGIHKFDDLKANEIAWDTMKSLELVKFDSLPELTLLPEGLQRFTSLRELHVWRCGVKEIPAWIDKLEALEKLVIRVCPNMESLPDEIQSVNLKTLEIEDCPTLLRRCEKKTGADWHKIARIPEKRLGWTSGR